VPVLPLRNHCPSSASLHPPPTSSLLQAIAAAQAHAQAVAQQAAVAAQAQQNAALTAQQQAYTNSVIGSAQQVLYWHARVESRHILSE
jgi:hypothetical protein